MEYRESIDKLIGGINSACSESYEILRSILKSDLSPRDEDIEWCI